VSVGGVAQSNGITANDFSSPVDYVVTALDGTTTTYTVTVTFLWTPAQLTTALWFDASDATTITTVSGAVSQWNDKSGNGRHATQGTPSNRPAYVASSINGLNAIDFDGSSDFMDFGGSLQPGSSDSTVLAVVSSDPAAAYDGRIISLHAAADGGTRFALYTEASYGYRSIHSATYTPVTTSYVTGLQMVGGYKTGTTLGVGLNGGTYTTNSSGGSVPTINAWRIGAYSGTDSRFDGRIAEIVVMLSYSSENRQRIEGYLAHKWGATSSLPADHPYKSTAP
jgi:hypothetical protein